MSGFGIIYLVVQGLVFAVWAFLMFRALFGVMRRSLETLEASCRGWFGHNLAMFLGYFSDPSVAQERRVLGLVTVVLIAMTVGSAFVVGGA